DQSRTWCGTSSSAPAATGSLPTGWRTSRSGGSEWRARLRITPMNSNTRDWRPQGYAEAEAAMAISPRERVPLQNQATCHVRSCQHKMPIVENLNSIVSKLAGRSAHICAFPWKFAGGEAALVRVVGFTDPD